MSPVQTIAIAIAFLLLAAALWLVRRDTQAGRELARDTVAVVWAAYVVHAAVTAWLAWAAPLGRIGVPAALGHVAGGFVAGVGAWIVFESIATFASFQRMSGRDTSELVTDGIYRFSRNPQNFGWWLVLTGAALVGRSASAFALATVFAVVVHAYIVWMEEPYLERLYGDAYREYRRRSPRYFGVPRETDGT